MLADKCIISLPPALPHPTVRTHFGEFCIWVSPCPTQPGENKGFAKKELVRLVNNKELHIYNTSSLHTSLFILIRPVLLNRFVCLF